MDRYEILIGKRPPKPKSEKAEIPEPEFKRVFYLGDKQAGKTTALLKDMINILAHPISRVAYSSFNLEDAQRVFRDIIRAIGQVPYGYQHYPDVKRRIYAMDFGEVPFVSSQVQALYIDNISDYFGREYLPVFSALDKLCNYQVPRIIVACHRGDFFEAVETLIRPSPCFSAVLRNDYFAYMGEIWQIIDLSAPSKVQGELYRPFRI